MAAKKRITKKSTSRSATTTRKKDPTEATELMVVNDLPGEECRVAILQKNHLEELYTERTATATNVGNIYKGRVVNVESAIQAAFIDYGEGQNGFLHISDLHPRYFPGGGSTERVGKKIPRRERPPIQQALKRGDELLVQVLKEGIGTKGPTLTSYISIPGRLLVMMPDMDRVGVSRKVEDEQQRREMRKILDSLDLPEGFGFIVRTAGLNETKTELKRDVAYLTRLWKAMDKRIQNVGAPCPLYTESDLLIRTVRDVLRSSIKAIVVDSQSAFERASAFLQVVAPRSAPRVIHYQQATPIFHAFDVERQIELIHSREVPLPSGGALVIDQTEALVAIDVNSGKSRSAQDAETNAYRTNCEAVDEIARQLRLRDLGGLVVNDLIDMRQHKNRRDIEDRFRLHLKSDRARTTILKISEFGIIEMTRQRMRPGIGKANFVGCTHCHGRGEIRAPEYLGSYAVRHIGYLMQYEQVDRVEIVCSPHVASYLLSQKRRQLVDMEDDTGKRIDVRVSEAIAADRVDFYAYDRRNADIAIERLPASPFPDLDELEAAPPAPRAAESETESEAEGGGRRRRRRRRRRGGPADATAIAFAALESGELDAAELEDEDEDREEVTAEAIEPAAEEEPRTGRRKRSRRRRGGRRGERETTEAVTTEPAEASQETEDAREAVEAVEAETVQAATVQLGPDETIRVHVLAKQLGVTSKDLLERCRAAGMELKNHMSSVGGESVTQICELLAPAAPVAAKTATTDDRPQATSTDEDDETSREGTRRRRRRGGRGRRGGGRSETRTEPVEESEPQREFEVDVVASDDEDDNEASRVSRDADEPAAAAERLRLRLARAAEMDGEDAAPRKRRRRGGRGRKKRTTETADDGASAAKAAPTEAEAGGGDEPVARETKGRGRKKTRSRKSKDAASEAVAAETPPDDNGRPTRRRKSAKTPAEPVAVSTAEPKSDAEPKPKPRRALYRSRTRVAAGARTERDD